MKKTIPASAGQAHTSQSPPRSTDKHRQQANGLESGPLAQLAESMNNSSQVRALTAMSAGMNPTSASKMFSTQHYSTPAQLVPVIQGKFTCNNCGAEYAKKPRKGECTSCGSDDLTEEAERPTFGDWWESIGDQRRQELLRAHGSHEQHGGNQQKQKGGGPKKGNQHDVGVANAKRQIREKYENGELN